MAIPVPGNQDAAPAVPVPANGEAAPAVHVQVNLHVEVAPAIPVPANVEAAPAIPVPANGEAAPAIPVPANGEGAPAVPVPANGEVAPAVPVPANGEVAPAVPVPANGERAPAVPIPANGEGAPVVPVPANGERAPAVPIPANGEGAPAIPVPANGEGAPAIPVPANGEAAPDVPANGAVALADQVPADQDQRRPRPLTLEQLLFYMIFLGTLILLRPVTNTKHPLMTIGTRYGSMLFMTNFPDDTIGVGDIVSAKVPGQELPWIRRVVEVKEDGENNLLYLTKGDNVDNKFPVSDTADPNPLSPIWLTRNEILSKMKMNIPLLGIPRLLMVSISDSPYLAPIKYLALAFVYFYLTFMVVGSVIAVCTLYARA
ncbi:PREDICTED: uncharacterized protein LOC109462492 [Branchiostoma belcheri]|uniref:Signal peptidase complex catalytic subunit SEC11 n=1 Tax=Branchiostoma belcheri TaxID=7741 RepID=A0A6P4YCI1_BRABE|nr:PREDICTED: uncharacterized protein LOC109462492 [Branchiostoma belcheri]XP_019614607.1 PREDICTED: uncharacterized protein LOC109462492 [Branchiostoma belcheri]